ncbi:MAG: hypothetical protein HQM05_17500, partial [Magnetococcales bacterium]|nr:hypothetical protein [Magnetococcales bacterium]
TPVHTATVTVHQLADQQKQFSEQMQQTTQKVDHLSNHMQSLSEQHLLQQQQMSALVNQLADTGGRLQRLEQQSQQPPPPPPATQPTPPAPLLAAPTPPPDDSTTIAWMIAALAALAALASKAYQYWQQHRRVEPSHAEPNDTPPVSALQAEDVMPSAHANTAPDNALQRLAWRPQEEEEQEESIFKDMLENPPSTPARV